MVPPALHLHDEEVEKWHNGDAVDLDLLVQADLGEPEIGRHEDVDFDAAPPVGLPDREAAVENLVSSPDLSGGLEKVSVVRVDNGLFDLLGVERFVFVPQDDVDILCGPFGV